MQEIIQRRAGRAIEQAARTLAIDLSSVRHVMTPPVTRSVTGFTVMITRHALRIRRRTHAYGTRRLARLARLPVAGARAEGQRHFYIDGDVTQ